MPRKVKTLADFDLTTRIGRHRARAKGFDVPKRENTGFGKAYWSKDANHDEIVNGLQARGIVVYEMPMPGDVLCYYRGGHPIITETWLPIEFKVKGGRATKAQSARKLAPIPVALSLVDALALFGLTIEASK